MENGPPLCHVLFTFCSFMTVHSSIVYVQDTAVWAHLPTTAGATYVSDLAALTIWAADLMLLPTTYASATVLFFLSSV
jgi:hypothetical protein